MTTNNKLQAIIYKVVLVDRGLEGNLVTRYIISALKVRIILVDIYYQVVIGYDFQLSTIVWLQLTIKGVT